MFRQFLAKGENVEHAEYLGSNAIFGMGEHSFGALTDRRVASIKVGPGGLVIYHDGFLEYVNSTAIHQPSKLGLYILCFIFFCFFGGFPAALYEVAGNMWYLVVPLNILMGLVGIYLGVRMWYGVVKCGLVFHIKEGMPVHLFTNRNRLVVANRLYRTLSDTRDKRLSGVSHSF
jgi:hypothetical protein